MEQGCDTHTKDSMVAPNGLPSVREWPRTAQRSSPCSDERPSSGQTGALADDVSSAPAFAGGNANPDPKNSVVSSASQAPPVGRATARGSRVRADVRSGIAPARDDGASPPPVASPLPVRPDSARAAATNAVTPRFFPGSAVAAAAAALW